MAITRRIAMHPYLVSMLLVSVAAARVTGQGTAGAPGHAPAQPLADDAELSLELVVGGLQQPVHVVAPPADRQRLFVAEQVTGLVRVVVDGALLPTPFLDLSTRLTSTGENGLLSLAFHPDFANNGRCFVYYNDLQGATVLEEYAVVPPTADVAVPDSGIVLLTMMQPFPQHNGGILAFGPHDGRLYLSTGDGGGAADPLDQGQDLSSLLGKVLRLDVDSGSPYAIPSDNPFVGVSGAREEIWAYGARNPWRGSFDSATGDLWIGDVGQSDREEVDRLAAGVAGVNLGWRCAEGTLCTFAKGCACPSPSFADPIHEYDHNDGCAIVGGHVYRGPALPGLNGTFFFGDYCTGRIWSFVFDGQTKTELRERTLELLHPNGGGLGRISTFGLDGQGELLIASYNLGEVYRVVPAAYVADCDGDGVPDEQELLVGDEFDVNGNGLPDSCELTLDLTPLVKGSSATIELIGSTPGLPVRFYYTWRGIGPGPCLGLGSVCLDLIAVSMDGNPVVPLLATVTTDPQGVATHSWVLPSDYPHPELAFQAVIVDGDQSQKSQPIQALVQ